MKTIQDGWQMRICREESSETKNKRPSSLINWIIRLMVLGVFIFLVANNYSNKTETRAISLNELYAAIDEGKIAELNIDIVNHRATGKFTDKKLFVTGVADTEELEKKALSKGTKTTANAQSEGWGIVIALAPTLLMVVLVIWFLGRMNKASTAGGGGLNSFLTSGNKTFGYWEPNTRKVFDDVAGCDEVKEEVKFFIEFLKNPEKFARLGAHVPRGLLLVGSPGTGKTLLAKAMAGEADVPFGYISGSDFVEMLVGVGASRVRMLFVEAKKQSPCILFVDEIDAIGKRRSFDLRGSHSEQEQALNQILAEMDGFKSDEGVLVVAATNRPELLDPALLRPGRFDRKIEVPLPDIKGREMILKVHARKLKVAAGVDFATLAKITPMLSGADLENIVNEAGIIATVRGAETVEQNDFFEAFEKVTFGLSKRDRIIFQKEREMVAFHEAGHTLVARNLPDTDPVRKVTIIGRGQSGGATHFLPKEDYRLITKRRLEAQLAVAMGGRAAEVHKFEDESSGARADFAHATEIAKMMVRELGMSRKVGKRVFVQRGDFLGMVGEPTDCSPETLRLIDEEVKEYLDKAYETAVKIIEENAAKLEILSQALLEKETLSGEEVDQLLNVSA